MKVGSVNVKKYLLIVNKKSLGTMKRLISNSKCTTDWCFSLILKTKAANKVELFG